MVRIVRGDGPLRPDKAHELGFGPNGSPLFQLFQAFRRSTPKPKVAGSWARLLVVSDNDVAEEFARKFHDGDPEYQDDTEWWKLVDEEDRKLLTKDASTDKSDDGLEGFLDGSDQESVVGPDVPTTTAPEPPPRTPIATLSREYRHDRSNQRWDVRAWAVEDVDPELGGQHVPWRLSATASGEHDFFVNSTHDVFASATLTTLDALLAELAWSAKDFLRGEESDLPFGLLLAELRERYTGTTKLDPVALSAEASLALSDIAKRVSRELDTEDNRALFEEMSPGEQEATLQKMATRQLADPQAAIAAGRFLEHAPFTSVIGFFARHPELFFDGRYWDDVYSELDYGRPSATEEAKGQLVRYYEGLLADAIWLAAQDIEDSGSFDRVRLLRASLALELLAPSTAADGS